ncbi:calcium-binding protein [Rhizobium sp. TRM95796]|uniref:calcium-binding protein n=1 Tax=Rhizobium sp. TRM95796 TaxID=2979862 RepID=UPI0021E89CB7|nr:calcium-binding protein [Rhizobium sp. TRM95796]MCV3765085.1 M10 family metallopeptidase C-terminal domain-containing protein [Rhizobium sp. TRM95796]
MSETQTWRLASKTDYDYLDSNLSGLRFTQGLVWNADANEWISSWQYGMARLDADFNFLQTTGSIDLSNFDIKTGIPAELAAMGFDHIGDIDYYDGRVYISLDSEEGDYQNGHVAVLNASDLSYTGELYELKGDPTNEHDDVASWVAVDGEAGVGYGKEWQSGDTINVYDLDDWSFTGTLQMDKSLKNIQGAKVLDGVMYMAAHDSTRSVYSLDLSTGHVEELFQLPTPSGGRTETEGLEVRKNDKGEVEITVELIIDPSGDNEGDAYTRLFTYVLDDSGSGNADLHHAWSVNTGSDATDAEDYALTLREAFAKLPEGDSIRFAAALAGETVTVETDSITVTRDVAISGAIAEGVTLASHFATSALTVSSGVLTLDAVNVIDGDAGVSITVSGGSVALEHGATVETISTSVDDFHLVKGAANLTLAGSAVTGYGNAAANTLTGSDRANHLLSGSGDDIVAGNGGNDILEGQAGADTLSGGAGRDFLIGGAGADRLDGGAGYDQLSGGQGADVFVFASGDSSSRLNAADVIYDFSGRAGDILDLSAIDANSNRKGDQAFKFIGSDAFSGHAGELRAFTRDGDTYLAGDTDGDGKRDFALHLSGAVSLTADQFAL